MVDDEMLKFMADDDSQPLYQEMAREVLVLRWSEITPENLPKVGDEVGNWEENSVGKPYFYFRAVDDECEQIAEDFIPISDMQHEDWRELEFTHRRPINAPVKLKRSRTRRK